MSDSPTDWDKVRNALRRLNPEFHEMDSSWTALDHIEAEVERLRGTLSMIAEAGTYEDALLARTAIAAAHQGEGT